MSRIDGSVTRVAPSIRHLMAQHNETKSDQRSERRKRREQMKSKQFTKKQRMHTQPVHMCREQRGIEISSTVPYPIDGHPRQEENAPGDLVVELPLQQVVHARGGVAGAAHARQHVGQNETRSLGLCVTALGVSQLTTSIKLWKGVANKCTGCMHTQQVVRR